MGEAQRWKLQGCDGRAPLSCDTTPERPDKCEEHGTEDDKVVPTDRRHLEGLHAFIARESRVPTDDATGLWLAPDEPRTDSRPKRMTTAASVWDR